MLLQPPASRGNLSRFFGALGARPTQQMENTDVRLTDLDKGILSFGSMTLLVGALGLAGLLFWGWYTEQALPLWPALLVSGVNVFGAGKLLHETKVKQAAQRAAAATTTRRT